MKKRVIFILFIIALMLVSFASGANKTIKEMIQEHYAKEAQEPVDPCGNGIIDENENCENCKDAVCKVDEVCEKRKCVPNGLNFTFYFAIVVLALLVTFIAFLAFKYNIISWIVDKTREEKAVLIIALLFIIFLLLVVYRDMNTFSLSLPPSHPDEFASVIIDKDVADWIFRLYAKNSPKEFVVCLKGEYAKGRYEVYELVGAEILKAGEYNIAYEPCSKFSHIGSLHSHYYPEPCNLSTGDIYAFGQKGDILSGLVCANSTIRFFNKQFLNIPVHTVIR